MNFWVNALANPNIDPEEKHLYLEFSWIHLSTICGSHAVLGIE